MAIKALYTAVGRFEHRTNGCRRSYPVIILGGKEYMVDIQEMMIWTCLNWRITRFEEIGILYAGITPASGSIAKRSWEECVERLLMRGLLVCGKGETEYDALYDLLSSMYIIPTDGSKALRIISFLKLILFNHVPYSSAKKLFQKDQRTKSEKQVMALARQALFSTAELIRCVEKDLCFFPTEESILEGIYDDPDTTSDNIGCLMRVASSSQTVIVAVANLYLRQQIVFERI